MSGATGANGGAGSGAAKRGGPGPSVPQGGAGVGPADRVPGFGPAPAAGREAAGTTSMMPTVQAASSGGTPPRAPAVGGAPRRRQGGAQGQQATQQAVQAAPAPPAHAPAVPPERPGYSKPTTYQKGQPTPARGTQVPPTAAAPVAAAPVAGVAGPAAAAGRTGRSGPAAAPAAGPAAPPSGRTRRARLRVARTDPWSVMKISFLLSIALGVVTVVGVALLWMVLDTAQVFSSVGGTLKQATGTDQNGGFDLQSYLSFGNVMTFTALIAVIDVVLLTALATLGSFIYNTAAGMTGGVELTLAEED
ncbi:DUF3566 domain-containing protein [Streptacidiphilus sp. N1-12]|uniref:DUF3566 domain-containing protein n=2 Tax=Streptacidiphilus alkalitolerans TaxID=3342712 RepID=A0ABV6WEC9_9ACTN